MKLKGLWGASLVLVALAASSCEEQQKAPLAEPAPASLRTTEQQARSSNKVLILGSSVAGGMDSREALAVPPADDFGNPYTVHVVDPAQWSAMTANQFMEYRAIIIGDAACQTGTEAFQAAVDNNNIWGAIVDGNVAIVAADSTSNQIPMLVESAVQFVLKKPYVTGMYVSLGCAYQDAPAGTPVPLLAPFGEFTVQGVSCAPAAHLFYTSSSTPPDFADYNYGADETLLGADGCSARSVFTSYPSHTFTNAAIATPPEGQTYPGQQTYYDYFMGMEFTGAPYMLLIGNSAKSAGCSYFPGDGEPPTPNEQCDLGDGANGRPKGPSQTPDQTCSWSCHLNWCGDGFVDPGEECDLGGDNGRSDDSSGSIGACTAFCKIPNLPDPTTSPPNALCQDVTVVAEYTCGMDANIDNGSNDPDGDLVGCTQHPAGPYDIGTHLVTLACTDSEGSTATCEGTVTVTDSVYPTIALTGSASETLECAAGGTYNDPGATAEDICEGPLTPVVSGTVNMGTPALYTLSYSVTDSSGNSPDPVTRSVTVQDTLKPTLALNGLANEGLECGTPYVDPGAEANDQCAGNLNAAIVKNGAVNHMVPSSYPITYNVTDPSNNAATEVSRVVTVSDTLQPEVSVTGPLSVALECGGGTYTDPGAEATDACAGVLEAVPSSVPNPNQPGTTTITYSATDPSGNTGVSSTSRTVTVSDTLPPTLTVLGTSPMGLECGSTFVDPFAEASDQCEGDLTGAIVQGGTVNSGTPGSYPLTYTVADAQGHTASGNRTVNVTDTLVPVVSVTGALNVALECGSGPYTDPGATAEDACAGTLPVDRSATPNPNQPGTTVISYSATDPSGNTGTASAQRTVTVSDTLPPTIALNGPATQTLECKASYVEQGASASDQCAGDLTGAIVTNGTVDTNTPNNYTVNYSVADGEGHTAATSRTVQVVDTQAPVVTVLGALEVPLECGAGTYTDPGAEANDACVGVLTAVPSTVPDQDQPGSYVISYSATDPYGNTGTSSASRTVTVSDTLPPTLNLLGGTPLTQECKTPFTDPGAEASDQCAGDLTTAIVKTGGVNTDLPGDYTLGYSVNDGEGHTVAADRIVQVRDTQLPTVTVNGPLDQQLECGSTYTDPGAEATDACAGVLTVDASATPNPNQPGTTVISYSATDPSGNTGTASAQRTVTVSDNTPPTLALNGSASQALECGDPFADPGAKAEDACFGDLTGSIVTTGSVNSQAPGSYALTYNVTDPAGLSAPAVQRTVTVSDTKDPIVTVLGELSQQVECGSGPYTDPGATATDACAGALEAVPSSVPNPNAPNTYTISYTAKDPSGNTGTSSTSRTVTVSDNLPPSLMLLGNAIQPLECATPFSDPGATANDQCAGDLTSAIVRTGSVNNMLPADYELTYTVQDPAGLSAPQVNRTVQVRDTTDPSITVLGNLSDTYECGSGPYADPGATAADTCAGDLTGSIVASQTGDPSQPGQFTITYSVSDPSGNMYTSPVVRTVAVNDNAPPTLALVGPATQTLECATPYTDPGATADDACFGDLTGSIVTTGSVNNQAPGSYALTYNVTDPAGQSAPAVQRTVNVSDTLPPSITVLGELSQQVQCGSGPYPDPGATATDACAGDLTGSIVTTGSVNTGAAGNYTLGYSVSDPSGNMTTAAETRTVTVIDDAAPTISLQGSANLGLECGTPFADPGATANDLCAGDLTSAIVTSGSVDHQVPGNYPVTYTVTDPSNHTATTSRTVSVSDTLPPTLALNGAATESLECGSMYVDQGATATDVCEGDLTDSVQVSGAVDPNTVNTYTVTYSVQDSAGHVAPTLSRTVNVDDTLAPSITVLGPLSHTYECGSGPYADPGASANDACAGDLTGSIVATQTGSSSEPGTSFTVEYSVTDPSGNSATSPVVRTVAVQDNAAPTLALVGPATQTLECGTPFTDPGATANDACFGDLTAAISVSGTVNTSVPRADPYTLIYNVEDSVGNVATPVTRAVTVQDTQVPSITVLGSLEETYECGTTYTDPGATAVDSCAGDLTAAIVATRTTDPNAPGNFTITYSVQDPSGNQATSPVTRSVTVNDDAPPSISLIGPETQFLECSRNPYVDPGAEATDLCVGGPVPYTVTGTVNMQVDGIYTLQYSATDPAGNTSSTLTRTVNVNDSVGPAITLLGADPMVLECKRDQYVEPGATADDLCSGPATVTIDESGVDESKTGAYLVRYTATDASGNMFETVRDVLVEDHLQPTLTLNEPNPMRLECGIDTFVDPGATAIDLCQGDVSASISIEFNNVNRNVEGDYIVRYRAQDGQTESVTAERNVVVDDLTGPVLSITGEANPVIECGSTPDLKGGVTALDACYGTLAADLITVTPETLPTEPGDHTVTYSAVDPVGNASASALERTFTVQDTTAPVLCTKASPDAPCLPFGDQDILYECTGHGNNQWAPPIVAAQDMCEGTIPVHPYNTGDDDQDGIPGCDCNYSPCGGEGVPDGGDDPNTACDEQDFGPGPSTENEGLYYVQYLAWDESFNIQGAILSVYVQDTIKPTITLNGPPTVQTQCYLPLDDGETDPDPYIDLGATAQDICYGDLNQELFCNSGVNKAFPGSYPVECTVRDGAYNWADPVIRTVEVIDNIAPAIAVKPTLTIAPPDNLMRTIDLSECVESIKDRCEGYLNPDNRAEVGVITCDDPGSCAGDIEVLSNSRFQLRAELNSDGTNRTYTVPFTVVDNSGNIATEACTFEVKPSTISEPQSAFGSGTLAGR